VTEPGRTAGHRPPTYGRAADARFALPHLPRRALLLGVADDWAAGLRMGGCDVVQRGEGQPDTVVCAPAALTEALATGAEAVLVEGAVRRVPAGWRVSRWQLVLRRDLPVALAPFGDAGLVRAAVERWEPARPPTVAAKRILGTIARTGRLPVLPVVSVLARDDVRIHAVRAAEELGVRGPHRPLVLTGGGTPVRRLGVLLWEPGARRPTWAVKTARHPGGDERMLADVRGSQAARVASDDDVNIPRVLGWLPGDERTPATSVEEAASGVSLALLLGRRRPGTRDVVLRLTGWLDRLAVATRRAADGSATGAGERLLPWWPDAPAVHEAVRRLQGLPTVVAHTDLGLGGNVLVHDGRLSLLDWEHTRLDGLPLTDLLPVLACSLARLRVGPEPAAVCEEVIRAALGRSPDSPLLHSAVRRHLAVLGIPLDVAGPLAALAWAQAGSRSRVQDANLTARGLPLTSWDSPLNRVSACWLDTPELGSAWSVLSQ
jgi:hypothetical protein